MTRPWQRLARRNRIVRGTQAMAVALLATGLYWFVAAPPAAPITSPAAAPVSYVAPDECPDRSQPVGTIICTGLTLHLAGGATMRVERAAAMISNLGETQDRAPVAVSRDGRSLAYLDAPTFRIVALNLRTGTTRPLTPVLTGDEVGKQADLAISPDGTHFSVSLRARRRTIVTEVETGAVRHVSGLCSVVGLTPQAIYGTRDCQERGTLFRVGPDSAFTRVGELVADWTGAGLSSDGKMLAGSGPGGAVAFYDAESGKWKKTRMLALPPNWTPIGWTAEGHILASSDNAFHTVDLQTGELASYGGASPRDHVVPR